LPNDIYSLINSNDTAQDLWDALKRHMSGSKFGEQDRKAAILYEYETFKDIEGEQLLNAYLHYLQVINDLNKCGYKKDNYELNYKFLNNLQPKWKQYAMGYKKKAVMVTSDPLALVPEKTKVSKSREKFVVKSESEGSDDNDITNNKPENVNSKEKKEDKKADGKKRDMSKVKCYNFKKEGHFAKDCKKVKVKDYNYYKTKMLLAKKDNDKQVLLAEDQAWIESSSDSDQDISANMVFMAKIKKVLSDSEVSSSSDEETITEVSYYSSDSKSESEYETSDYYDNSTNYGLFVDKDDDLENFHDAIESASEKINENHIVSQKDHDESKVDHNQFEEKYHLINKLIAKFNQKIAKCQKRIEKANQQRTNLENQN
ncbi:retrovirus-related pol polyprotein from transposon TNT 1-94, partial [Tanacetum coccineum]